MARLRQCDWAKRDVVVRLGSNLGIPHFRSFHNLPIVLCLSPLSCGVNKHVTCHIWRHSCATHLVKNKANLRQVQELLGHRDLSTTERYLHLTIADLKEAHRKFHPRERGEASL